MSSDAIRSVLQDTRLRKDGPGGRGGRGGRGGGARGGRGGGGRGGGRGGFSAPPAGRKRTRERQEARAGKGLLKRKPVTAPQPQSGAGMRRPNAATAAGAAARSKSQSGAPVAAAAAAAAGARGNANKPKPKSKFFALAEAKGLLTAAVSSDGSIPKDGEMVELERKLGLTKPSNQQKLKKEMEEDGMGDMWDFLNSFESRLKQKLTKDKADGTPDARTAQAEAEADDALAAAATGDTGDADSGDADADAEDADGDDDDGDANDLKEFTDEEMKQMLREQEAGDDDGDDGDDGEGEFEDDENGDDDDDDLASEGEGEGEGGANDASDGSENDADEPTKRPAKKLKVEAVADSKSKSKSKSAAGDGLTALERLARDRNVSLTDDSTGDGGDDDSTAGAGADAAASTRDRSAPRLIYGQNETPAVPLPASANGKATSLPTKYVPPHLRVAAAAATTVATAAGTTPTGKPLSADELRQRAAITKELKSRLNRLSELNIEAITNEIKTVYAAHNRRLVTETLSSIMLSICTHTHADHREHSSTKAVIVTYVALVAALHSYVNKDIGAYVLEQFVAAFDAAYRAGNTQHSNNLLLFVCHLFVFEITDHVLIYDMIRMLCDTFTPIDVELLLQLITHCGYQLRKDDAKALKDIVLLIQSKALASTKGASSNPAASTTANSSARDGDEQMDSGTVAVPAVGSTFSARVRFMLDLIADVKNDKRRLAAAQQPLIDPLKKWLTKAVQHAKKADSSDRQLHLSYSDITSIPEKGRWWIVGGSYRGNMASSRNDAKSKTAAGADGDDADAEVDAADEKASAAAAAADPDGDDATAVDVASLTKLARAQRMNTQLRKNVFFVVMSADDYMDAFEKLEKMNLIEKQRREVARVILDCCAQEKSYNPYYSVLAAKLCSYHKTYRFTYQLALWDLFKQLSGWSARKTHNLARFTVHLISAHLLSLGVLKSLPLTSLSGPGVLYVLSVLTGLFTTAPDSVEKVFQSISSKPDLDFHSGLLFVLKRYVDLSLKQETDSAKAKLIRDGATIAKRQLAVAAAAGLDRPAKKKSTGFDDDSGDDNDAGGNAARTAEDDDDDPFARADSEQPDRDD